MAYKRKTKDVWYVQGDYGYGDGWEDLGGSESRKKAVTDLVAYRTEERQGKYRLKKKREKI